MLRLRTLVAALTAAALALSAGAAGLRYVFCAPMGEARLHCCCPHERDHDAIARACCDDRAVPELASVDRHEDAPRTLAAGLVLVLPLAWRFPSALPAADAALRRDDPRARAGPGPRVHAVISVYLV